MYTEKPGGYSVVIQAHQPAPLEVYIPSHYSTL